MLKINKVAEIWLKLKKMPLCQQNRINLYKSSELKLKNISGNKLHLYYYYLIFKSISNYYSLLKMNIAIFLINSLEQYV